MAKTRSVGHLLNNANAGLAKVIQRSKELKKLTNTLKNLVDSPLSEHIYVANIRDKTLVIGTDSAVWHTRIKYLAPVILEQIRQVPGLERLQQVEFKIQHLFSEAIRRWSNLHNRRMIACSLYYSALRKRKTKTRASR
jgi:hypothetical protein